MKICIDNIVYYLQKSGGISIYWYEIINRLIRDNIDVTYILRNEESNTFLKDLKIEDNYLIQSGLPLKLARYLPVSVKENERHIFHSTYYRYSKSPNSVNLTTVHDFTYEKFVSGIKRKIHSHQKGIAIKKSEGIICISENTKKDMLYYFPELQEKKIKVIYNGSSDIFSVTKDNTTENESVKRVLDKKYILFVGGRGGYKNFTIAIDIIKKLDDSYSLVVVGGDFTKEEQNLLATVKDKIELIKYPSQKDLNILYNKAFCLLYPSLYEGFGICLVEAMKCGCPALASNNSCISEVMGNIETMVKKSDVNQYIDMIYKLENPEFREQIIAKGFEQSKKFNWENTYREILDFYSEFK